ncbi:sulfatase-like hydrolase/transferase [Rhizobium giardinii]|uniref:sulfatase-like hydrolase/transferase n=1 Tax=Rhizobium giardinii TaxID=56731 RepID=UPI0039E0D62B
MGDIDLSEPTGTFQALIRNHGRSRWNWRHKRKAKEVVGLAPSPNGAASHEPFTAPERFRDGFRTGWNGPIRDWPRYGRVDELPEECQELRANYYAVVALCDFLIGQLLDYFDTQDLWRDTALVVTTDHGFLLGEHDFWAKNRMNMYEEIVHIPLFVHDPRRPGSAGTRRSALTQTIDLAPTFLDLDASFRARSPER